MEKRRVLAQNLVPRDAAGGRGKLGRETEPVYEVEAKFPVSGLQALESRLVALGARFGDPVEQVDRYFAHPGRDFARTDEALRLRRTGRAIAITWKGPRIDTETKTRREIELPLAVPLPEPPEPPGPPGRDGDGAAERTLDRWTELLEALGFRPVATVAKRRRADRVP